MSQPREHRLTAAALADLERHEIVDGALVQKASPSFSHGATQGRILAALGGFWGHGGASGPGGWWLASEVAIELAADEAYLPDIAGWRIDRAPASALDERPVRIAPDWVCEILSPATARRDVSHKRDTYHRAQVSHYWVAHPDEQYLQVYRWQEGDYSLSLVARAGQVVRAEPFEAIALDVGSLFWQPSRQP